MSTELALTKNISPKMIFREISKKVVGMHEAKKIVSNFVFSHYALTCLNYEGKKFPNMRQLPFLVGPSGNGKTFLIKTAIEALQQLVGSAVCPLIEVDCTSLTPSGFVGNDISDILSSRLSSSHAANQDISSAIVYLDEFDKICTPFHCSGGEDFNKETQYTLLKCFEGSEIEVTTRRGGTLRLQTDRFGFVLSGNFPSIRSNREKAAKGSMGFTKGTISDSGDKTLKRLMQDGGLATQLAGRITNVIEIDRLTKEQLEMVVRQNLIPETVDFYDKLNYTVLIDNEMVDRIVEKAVSSELGARGLRSELERELVDVLFDTSYLYRHTIMGEPKNEDSPELH